MSTRWNPQKPTHTHTHTHTDKPWQVIKQIGTICLMLFSLFISPVFATEINNPATCDSGTLSTDTGPTNLRANYESNTLNLKWYDDNENLLDVSGTSSGTCTYGGTINMPTPPTKRGYTFKGWKVAIYDFSTFNLAIGGSHRYGKGNSNNSDKCYYDGNNVTCGSDFADLNQQQWKTPFSYGTIYGKAICSTTSGTYAGRGSPSNTYGPNCWCRAIGYKPNGSNIMHIPTNNLPWVFRFEFGTENTAVAACPNTCALRCSGEHQYNRSFRQAIYGI